VKLQATDRALGNEQRPQPIQDIGVEADASLDDALCIACLALEAQRATPSTASRMTLNNKIEAGIPRANTTQGSTVQ